MRDVQEIVAERAEKLVTSGSERGPQVVAVGLADPATRLVAAGPARIRTGGWPSPSPRT